MPPLSAFGCEGANGEVGLVSVGVEGLKKLKPLLSGASLFGGLLEEGPTGSGTLPFVSISKLASATDSLGRAFGERSMVLMGLVDPKSGRKPRFPDPGVLPREMLLEPVSKLRFRSDISTMMYRRDYCLSLDALFSDSKLLHRRIQLRCRCHVHGWILL